MVIKKKEIEDSDIDEAVSFHNVNWDDKRTPKQWIWEYKGNCPDLFVFTILRDNNSIIGTQGMIPIYLNINGKTHLSGRSENSLLDRKYRGRGLFTELYGFALFLCKAKKMCCVWGFTGVASAIKVLSRLGFSVYENVIYWSILILNPWQFILSILSSRLGMIRKMTGFLLVVPLYLYSSAFRFTFGCFKRTPREFSIELKLRSVSDVDKLYKRLRAKYRDIIHIEQDEKYIAWRILNNPNLEYTTYFAYEDEFLRAYCYVVLTDKKTAYLTDLTFEDSEAGNFLLRTILNLLRKRKTTNLRFMGNIKNPLVANVFNLLKKHGFVKEREFRPFVLKNISYQNEKYLHNIRNWYINGLWTEGYRL